MAFEDWGEFVQTLKRVLDFPHEDLEILVEVTEWTGSPQYRWKAKIMIAGGHANLGKGLPQVIQGLKRAVETIERWPRGMVPGELSQTVHSTKGPIGIVSALTAKARGQHRWIEYRRNYNRGPSRSINLSTSQAQRPAKELEEVSQVAQEMISFLESMGGA